MKKEKLTLTLKVKLLPTLEQKSLMKETMKTFNNYANLISPYSFNNKIKSKFQLQKNLYYDYIKDNPLGSQFLIKVFGKIASSYKDFRSLRIYKDFGSIDYDKRLMSIKVNDFISLKTINGREKIKYASTLKIQKIIELNLWGQSELFYDKYKDNFYLLLTYEPQIDKNDSYISTKKLAIDRGITNILSTSTGINIKADLIRKIIEKFNKTNINIKKKKTASARRKLKKRGRKHAKFVKNENHRISKEIVLHAKALQASIVMEDLSSITDKKTKATVKSYNISTKKFDYTKTKSFKKGLQGWSYYQLESMIRYKAQLEQVPVEDNISPYYTSQECAKCTYIHEDNRKGNKFKCLKCNHQEHADINAGQVIEKRSYIQPDIKIFKTKPKDFISSYLLKLYKKASVKKPNDTKLYQCDVKDLSKTVASFVL